MDGLVGWLVCQRLDTAHCETQSFDYFFHFYLGGRVRLGRTESINVVKRDTNSLCNVQKIEQVKPKMMFLVFFYNVVLLAFFCYCNNADLELYQNTWR